MNVNFYIKQIDEHHESRNQFLFSDDYAEMMINKQIEHNKKMFQVQSIEWMNEKRTELKAVCLEIKTKL